MSTATALITRDGLLEKLVRRTDIYSYVDRNWSELQVVGVYNLLDSFDVSTRTGKRVRSRGDEPTGSLSYDKYGNMAVQVMNGGRESVSNLDPETETERIKAAFHNYTAYFGTFQINEAGGYVTHLIRGSLSPDEVAKMRQRFFKISGNRLILTTPPFTTQGEERVRYIIWERVDQRKKLRLVKFMAEALANAVIAFQRYFRPSTD